MPQEQSRIFFQKNYPFSWFLCPRLDEYVAPFLGDFLDEHGYTWTPKADPPGLMFLSLILFSCFQETATTVRSFLGGLEVLISLMKSKNPKVKLKCSPYSKGRFCNNSGINTLISKRKPLCKPFLFCLSRYATWHVKWYQGWHWMQKTSKFLMIMISPVSSSIFVIR